MDITKLVGIFREFVKLLQNNYRVYEFNISSCNVLENMQFLAIGYIFPHDQGCTKL